MNKQKTLLLLSLFLIPLLGASGSFGYEHVKVLFFIFSTTLTGFIWLRGEPALKWTPVNLASAAFITALLVSSALGVNVAASLISMPDFYF